METQTVDHRPVRHRKPLSETSAWVNQQASVATTSSRLDAQSIPHHPSHNLQGNLQILHHPSLVPMAQDKRISAVSGSDRNTNRDSQASASSTQSKPRRKTHVGPWHLGKTVGQGATGRVRKARHVFTGQDVAVKIISKKAAALAQSQSLAMMEPLPSSLGHRGTPVGIAREVVVMKLIEHPNVVRLYDVWENRGEL